MTPDLAARCKRAINVVTTDDRVLRAGRASLFIFERCGYKWSCRFMAMRPMVWMVDIGYHIVSRHRRFFGRFMFRRE